MERNADGVTISDLTHQIGQPRTTVDRIMKTLQHHEVVPRGDNGSYELGARLLSLAAKAAAGSGSIDLPRILHPVRERLAEETGESVKLSVVDSEGLLVIACAQSRRNGFARDQREQSTSVNAVAAPPTMGETSSGVCRALSLVSVTLNANAARPNIGEEDAAFFD